MYIAPMPRRFLLLLGTLATIGVTACDQASDLLARFRGPDNTPPDSLPRLLNDSLPFQYPIGLYMQLVDDSVTLRLTVDTYGRPIPESTKVEVHAGHPQFDTSAVNGARELLFRPAIKRGKPVPYTVLFPIAFKIPTVPIKAPVDTTRR